MSKKKEKLLNFKGMRIEERLRKAFNIIILIASIGSIAGIISLLVVVSNFEKSMANYALPQGDIALFMNEYAECRSNTRGIIGYEDQAEIDLLVAKHETRITNTKSRFDAIHETIVTPEGENRLEDQYYAFYADEKQLQELILRLFYAPKRRA